MIPSNKTKIPRAVIILGFVSLFTDAATEMIYPLVPVFVAALGSGAIILGIIEGVAETTAAMIKLISGIISDKTGKRKLLVLTGYSISTFARPFTGAVSAAWEIVFVRMLDRVGKGIRTAPRDALIASSVDNTIRGKSFGFHRAMDHLGAVIGPVLALITLLILFFVFKITNPVLALRWTFFLSIIPGIFAVLMIIFFVKETSPGENRSKPFKFSFKSMDRNFKKYLFILVLFTLGNSSDAFLLYRVEEAIRGSGTVVEFVNGIKPLHDMITAFGNTGTQAQLINILFLPLIWSFFHIIKVAFSTPFGALSDRIGRKITINIGWAIYSFVYFSFAFLTFIPDKLQLLTTVILFAIYALYYAFTEGAERAFVSDIVNEENRGSAFGLYNFAIGLAALPASVIFGAVYSFVNLKYPGLGGTVAFSIGGLLALSAMLLLTFFVRETRGNGKT